MWTYKKRSRITALFMALTVVGITIFGIYLGVWQVFLIAGLAPVGTIVYWVGQEREHRGER